MFFHDAVALFSWIMNSVCSSKALYDSVQLYDHAWVTANWVYTYRMSVLSKFLEITYVVDFDTS